MYSLLKSMSVHDASRAAVSFGLAMIVAEFLFRFRSFSLECVAFVALWLLLDRAAHALLPAPRERAVERE
jgi:hypothetical protein